MHHHVHIVMDDILVFIPQSSPFVMEVSSYIATLVCQM